MNSDPCKVLVVDDDRSVLNNLKASLRRYPFEMRTTSDGAQALPLARSFDPDVILLDLNMPPPDGMTVLRELKTHAPGHEVIILTGEGSTERVVEAIKGGAYWFLDKPVDGETLREMIQRAAERRRFTHLVNVTQRLVGNSRPMDRLRSLIRHIADDPVTVLITGESGTGKELVAREIHALSSRNRAPFVAINCGAIAENLIENELFGHERGAFTDAREAKAGLFERASQGTILLDEISELPLSSQVKLLRVLQEREVLRVGGTRVIPVDVRVIAASNVDLAARVQQGRFREDLYYRLNVFPLAIPPLRERKEDIPLLARHFLQKSLALAGRRPKHIERFTPEAMDLLQRCDWKGNVRQLENAIERAVVICDSPQIAPEFLPEELRTQLPPRAEPSPAVPLPGRDLAETSWEEFHERYLPEVHRQWLRALLERYEGNRARAAREGANMDRANFRKLLTKFGVD